MDARPVRETLYWKFEDGPEDAPEEGSPDDVGPAWLDTFEGDTHTQEPISDGAWITRAEATRLASANGWELNIDD